MALGDLFTVHEFAPVRLTLERIGPFQERLETFEFAERGTPYNFFLLLSANGRGKTNLLELMVALMGMLGRNPEAPAGPIGFHSIDQGNGRAQWDLRLTYSTAAQPKRSVVLSLMAGAMEEETPLFSWAEHPDQLLELEAQGWHRLGIARSYAGTFRWLGIEDPWVRDLIAWTHISVGSKYDGILNTSLHAPTVLYFPAYRNIAELASDQDRVISPPRDWNYSPVKAFRQDGRLWSESLDNLLVWLKWLDDGRYEAALELVNEYVFKDSDKELDRVQKDPPAAIVHSSGGEHGLDRLSSGEKSLFQLFLRLGAYKTRNTILLIDEVDAHLHTTWRSRIALQLKELARTTPGLTVILATHSFEVMDALAMELEEEGLNKGAFLIETPAEEEAAARVRSTAQETYATTSEAETYAKSKEP